VKLSNAARFFNRTPFYDAYTDDALGVGQLDVYTEATRDGLTTQRRILEVTPGTKMPDRGAIRFHDTNWLIGTHAIDSFNGSVIREKHVLHQAEGPANITTLRQTLEGALPHEAFAARVWVKTTSQVEISSNKFNQVQVFLSATESIQTDMLIAIGGKLYTVMETYRATAGHLVALCEELDDGAVAVGVVEQRGPWDHITETYPTVSIPTKLVLLRWQSDFAYLSQSTPDFERGDMQAACLVEQPNGTLINLDGDNWRVQACQPRNSVYYLHLRRV